MDSIEIDELLTAIECALPSGDLQGLAPSFDVLPPEAVPRGLGLKYARVARRLGKPDLAVKVLFQPVREFRERVKASPAEVIEYCNNLIRLGCREEAGEYLGVLAEQCGSDSEFLLSQARYHVSGWNYEDALDFYNCYLDLENLDAYERAVAVTNKMACLIACDQSEGAMEILGAHFHLCRKRGWQRLATNAIDLRLQLAVLLRCWDELENIENDLSYLPGSPTAHEHLWIQKWRSISQALKENSLEPLAESYQLARRQKHWETLRSLDHHSLFVKFDQRLLDRLWYTTPFPSFKAKLESQFGEVSPTFSIHPEAEEQLNVDTGEMAKNKVLKVGSKTYLLLRALASDSYRPTFGPGLFGRLFPGEYYDPQTSANKVNLVITRARKWMKEKSLDLEITSGEGFSLVCHSVGLLLSKQGSLSFETSQLLQFQSLCNEEYFTRKQFSEAMGHNKSTSVRILNSGIEGKFIDKHGHGSTVSYRFRQRKSLI